MPGERPRRFIRIERKRRFFRRLVGLFVACVLTASVAAQAGPLLVEPPMNVFVNGRVIKVHTQAATVGGALADAGIDLSRGDRLYPAADFPLIHDQPIVVERKAYLDARAGRLDRFGTVLHAELTQVRAQTAAASAAARRPVWRKAGRHAVRSGVRQATGHKAGDSKSAVARPRHAAARPRHAATRPRHDYRVVKAIRMRATAYSSTFGTGRTATGTRARRGVVAVDPRFIPLGTRLYIKGYGFAVAADTGGAIRGDRIDLCFATHREAVRFGRRPVVVKILR